MLARTALMRATLTTCICGGHRKAGAGTCFSCSMRSSGSDETSSSVGDAEETDESSAAASFTKWVMRKLFAAIVDTWAEEDRDGPTKKSNIHCVALSWPGCGVICGCERDEVDVVTSTGRFAVRLGARGATHRRVLHANRSSRGSRCCSCCCSCCCRVRVARWRSCRRKRRRIVLLCDDGQESQRVRRVQRSPGTRKLHQVDMGYPQKDA